MKAICKVCNGPMSTRSVTGICAKHRVPSRKCECGKSIARDNVTGKCCMCLFPSNWVPADRIADFEYLANLKGWTARKAAEHINAGLPVERRWKHNAAHSIQSLALLKEIGAEMGVPVERIVGSGKSGRYVAARCVAAVVMRSRGMSFPQIGKRLGRDHSTIVNLTHRFDHYADARPRMREIVRRLAA